MIYRLEVDDFERAQLLTAARATASAATSNAQADPKNRWAQERAERCRVLLTKVMAAQAIEPAEEVGGGATEAPAG